MHPLIHNAINKEKITDVNYIMSFKPSTIMSESWVEDTQKK